MHVRFCSTTAVCCQDVKYGVRGVLSCSSLRTLDHVIKVIIFNYQVDVKVYIYKACVIEYRPSMIYIYICLYVLRFWYDQVGVVFGSPDVTSGGMALRFYSSVRLEVRKGQAIKQGGEMVGTKVGIVSRYCVP